MTLKCLIACVLTIFGLANIVLLFLTFRPNFVTVRHNNEIVMTDRIDLESSGPAHESENSIEELQQLYNKSQNQINIQKKVISLLSQPVVNNHNFNYIHNPSSACASEKVDILFVTPSVPNNFKYRLKVRNGSRGDYVKNSNGRSKLLFFLGEAKDTDLKSRIQQKVSEEFSKYGDVIQDGFVDIYGNLRFKAVSMLKWAVTFCPHAKYVIRTDDDVAVDPPKLVSAMERKSAISDNFILGRKAEKWTPIRNKENKYFLSEDEYPYSTLPPFALGGLLGYPMSTVKLLYQAALRVKPIWLDDVYITGVCADKVNVPLFDDPDFEFQHWSW